MRRMSVVVVVIERPLLLTCPRRSSPSLLPLHSSPIVGHHPLGSCGIQARCHPAHGEEPSHPPTRLDRRPRPTLLTHDTKPLLEMEPSSAKPQMYVLAGHWMSFEMSYALRRFSKGWSTPQMSCSGQCKC